MDLNYLNTEQFKENYDKLAKFLQNKRVVLFGGEDLDLIKSKCDLSSLNILGLFDSHFSPESYNKYFKGYKILSENIINILHPDYILDVNTDRFKLLYEQKFNSDIKYFSIFSNTDMPQLKYFEYHVTDHCNISCKSCDHFSPLAPKYFVDLDKFEMDIKELSNKLDIYSFSLLGGEPLLHKDLGKIVSIARKYFPISDIRIITNGILLPSMTEEFFIYCKKNNIKFQISLYPLFFDKENSFVNILNKYDINFSVLYQTHFYNRCLKQDNKENYFNLCHLKSCHALRNGKMYVCTLDCYVDYFNKFFNKSLPQSKGIDIYKYDGESILKFLNQSIELCKYCNVINRKEQKWDISKKDISEWMIE